MAMSTLLLSGCSSWWDRAVPRAEPAAVPWFVRRRPTPDQVLADRFTRGEVDEEEYRAPGGLALVRDGPPAVTARPGDELPRDTR
jgi:hypothetical protein